MTWFSDTKGGVCRVVVGAALTTTLTACVGDVDGRNGLGASQTASDRSRTGRLHCDRTLPSGECSRLAPIAVSRIPVPPWPLRGEYHKVHAIAGTPAFAVEYASALNPSVSVFEPSGTMVRRVSGVGRHVSPSSSGSSLLLRSLDRAVVVSVSDGSVKSAADVPDIDEASAVIPEPGDVDSWLLFESGRTTRVTSTLGRLNYRQHPPIAGGYVQAACIADSGDAVWVISDPNCATLVDRQTLLPRRSLSLPCQECGFDAASSGGRLWVSTSDGAGGIVTVAESGDPDARRLEWGAPGPTILASDTASRTLAVVTRGERRDDLRSIELRVFETTSAGRLDLRGLYRYDTDDLPEDIAVLGDGATIVIAEGRLGVHVIRFASAVDGVRRGE